MQMRGCLLDDCWQSEPIILSHPPWIQQSMLPRSFKVTASSTQTTSQIRWSTEHWPWPLGTASWMKTGWMNSFFSLHNAWWKAENRTLWNRNLVNLVNLMKIWSALLQRLEIGEPRTALDLAVWIYLMFTFSSKKCFLVLNSWHASGFSKYIECVRKVSTNPQRNINFACREKKMTCTIVVHEPSSPVR